MYKMSIGLTDPRLFYFNEFLGPTSMRVIRRRRQMRSVDQQRRYAKFMYASKVLRRDRPTRDTYAVYFMNRRMCHKLLNSTTRFIHTHTLSLFFPFMGAPQTKQIIRFSSVDIFIRLTPKTKTHIVI